MRCVDGKIIERRPDQDTAERPDSGIKLDAVGGKFGSGIAAVGEFGP